MQLPQEISDLARELEQAKQALHISREREALLSHELVHRVRNILAITHSIFSRTMETAASPEHAVDHFQGRLSAMARYHGRSASMPGTGFYLESMICDELLVFACGDDPRVKLSGPDVRLGHGTAEIFGLVLHELTTNSVKFGVLADTDGRGRLKIRWSVSAGVLDFDWTESEIAILTPAPMPRGFGRELIEDALPYQLGAETSFTLRPGGLHCHIRFEPKGPVRPMDLNR